MERAEINLQFLPEPEVVKQLSFEEIRAEVLADYQERFPKYSAALESDPIVKLLETVAYREIHIRAEANDGARAVMLAFAKGDDLDNLAALVPLERKTLIEGDADAYPPIEEVKEGNDEFRARVQLAPEGFSTAGSDGGYEFWAKSVPEVLDAYPVSPKKGEVLVSVLSRDGDGAPTAEVLAGVVAAYASDVRPLTDFVSVQSALVVDYEVVAVLYIQSGLVQASVLENANAEIRKYVASRKRLGASIARSGIDKALHVAGVDRVELLSPAADLILGADSAGNCTNVTISAVVG